MSVPSHTVASRARPRFRNGGGTEPLTGRQSVQQILPDGEALQTIEALQTQLLAAQNQALALHEACRLAEAVAQTAQDKLARLSHDLRTPLAAILAWTSVLLRPRVEASVRQEGLAVIERNARRQALLLDGWQTSTPFPQAEDTLLGSLSASSGFTPSLAGIRVLMVDDEPDLRDAVGRALRAAGAAVFTAGEAFEALTLLRVERPDVLVCDIEMPAVDGHDLLGRIRRLPLSAGGAIPAVALTGLDDPAQMQKTCKSGFQRHLNKGVSPEALVRAVYELAAEPAQNNK